MSRKNNNAMQDGAEYYWPVFFKRETAKKPNCKVCNNVKNVERGEKFGTTEYTCPGCKRTIIKKTEPEQNKPETNNCSCGGKMSVRTNSRDNSKFMGCSNYPKCKNTIKM